MNISSWPEGERPRERLIQQGPQSLSDAELLAIFLRTGLPGKSAVDLARDIIQQHGGLRQLSQISLAQWCQMPGLGAAKYAQFKACLEMASRCLDGQLRDNASVFNNPQQLVQFAQLQIGLSPVEQFLVIALDTQLRMIAHQVLAQGTIDRTAVYPREVLRYALDHKATRLMLAHNHPSGEVQPSAADDQLTRTLKQALQLVDVELVDHVVVSGQRWYSYRESGRL